MYEGLSVSVDKGGMMSARACGNFAAMLADETVMSVLMLRRAFRVTEGNRLDVGYFLGVSDVCAW